MWGSERERLEELARLYGVQTSYRDVEDELRRPSPESLAAVLRALGAPLDSPRDLSRALSARRLEEWSSPLPPVALAPGSVSIRFSLPEPPRLELRLRLENNEELSRSLSPEELPLVESGEVAGQRFNRRLVDLEKDWPGEARGTPLPWGYHRLELAGEGQDAACLVISAPRRCWGPGPEEHRAWGAFIPLYALYSQHSLGVGDLGDLRALLDWVEEMGGETAGTLPLLAAFLDEPFEPSPYSPVTRLFFNELYLDLRRVPELEISPAARLLLDDARARTARPGRLVDYRGVARVKGEVLRVLADAFFDRGTGHRRESFERFLNARPDVSEYARFRAVAQREGAGWPGWARPLDPGRVLPEHYDEAVWRFHIYVQWLLDEQLEAALGDEGGRLYLDLPLGVNGGGYDTWWEREIFAQGASGGAPPDTFFSGGQNWGFPPLHPRQLRAQGYRYFIASLRAQMRFARYLRIDHVMGLHRLFWIPDGFEATDGVYVTYPAEELYAVLCLESHRNQTIVLGEDLGTVPDYVRPAMSKHAVRRMYVLSYELNAGEETPGDEASSGRAETSGGEAIPGGEAAGTLTPVSPGVVASVNTHDMPPFAGFLTGEDVGERRSAGHLEAEAVDTALAERRRLTRTLAGWLEANGMLDPADAPTQAEMETPTDAELYGLLRGALRFLAQSPAELVLVNLEDLLLERRPQNVPGTSDERPNWQLRAAAALEDLREIPQVREALIEVNRLRNEHRKGMEPK